ncbi:sirtuin 5 [Moniliophthora roreri]|nr:sirtuin 5 [Moniliophthora roreri]
MPLEHISSKGQSFREALSLAENILILACAGLSAASGVPTFREGGGMWRSLDAMSLATLDAMQIPPLYGNFIIIGGASLSAQPNDAHHIISKLLVPEYLKKVAPKAKSCHLVMQNVDGLSMSAFLLHSAELNTKTKKAAIPPLWKCMEDSLMSTVLNPSVVTAVKIVPVPSAPPLQ